MKIRWKKTSSNIWVWQQWRIINTGSCYLVRSETTHAGSGKKTRRLHNQFCTLSDAKIYCDKMQAKQDYETEKGLQALGIQLMK